MTLAVSIQAMREDAGGWKDVADVLNGAANAASGLTLTKKDWSFISDDVSLVEAYEEVRSNCERLLREGNTNLTALSNTLYTVANDYQTSDENAAQRYKGIWDPNR
jgi:hypothetical protein